MENRDGDTFGNISIREINDFLTRLQELRGKGKYIMRAQGGPAVPM